jgi:DNA ligase (NAD+)
VLFALGIPHVGYVNAQLLADEFGSVEELAHAAPEQIAATAGVGPVIAEAVSSWFLDEEHAEVVEGLRRAGVQLSGPRRERAPDGPLTGKVVVVTGSIEGYSRDSIREHLEGLGAKVTDSVSKKTDYLVAGEGGGSKLAKAEQLGVAVVSLEELEAELPG